jgi:hypothetical protein
LEGNKSIFGKFETVLRIRDVYPGSKFFHPGSRVKKAPDPGFPTQQRILVFLTHKFFTKLSEISPGYFIRILDPIFSISDRGSIYQTRSQKCTRSRISNNGFGIRFICSNLSVYLLLDPDSNPGESNQRGSGSGKQHLPREKISF